MLEKKSVNIAIFIMSALAGLILLVFSLGTIKFDTGLSVKMAIIVISFFIYLLIVLVIILFLKAYEKPKEPQEIKTPRPTKNK